MRTTLVLDRQFCQRNPTGIDVALTTTAPATRSVLSHDSIHHLLLVLQRDVSLMQPLDHDTEGCITNQITTLAQGIDCVSIRTGIDTTSEFH